MEFTLTRAREIKFVRDEVDARVAEDEISRIEMTFLNWWTCGKVGGRIKS